MRRAIALLGLTVATFAANATTNASVALNNLQVRLIDLNTSDGITPSIVFDVVDGSSAVMGSTYPGMVDMTGHSSGTAFGSVSDSIGSPDFTSSASIVGDALLDGDSTVTSSVTTMGAGSAYAGAYLGNSNGYGTFTLSANTEVEVTGTMLAHVDVGADSVNESSTAMWQVALAQLTGGFHFTGEDVGAITAGNSNGFALSDDSSGSFDLTLTNLTSSSIDGAFYGSAYDYGYIAGGAGDPVGPALDAPEPSSLVLIILGGALVLLTKVLQDCRILRT